MKRVRREVTAIELAVLFVLCCIVASIVPARCSGEQAYRDHWEIDE